MRRQCKLLYIRIFSCPEGHAHPPQAYREEHSACPLASRLDGPGQAARRRSACARDGCAGSSCPRQRTSLSCGRCGHSGSWRYSTPLSILELFSPFNQETSEDWWGKGEKSLRRPQGSCPRSTCVNGVCLSKIVTFQLLPRCLNTSVSTAHMCQNSHCCVPTICGPGARVSQ